uniref:Transcription factor CBF/NF-Y/archaeal histone domain-containing protein n=1 Tax=Globodera rostochiensis TaxID=31243 RepID=A0A914HKC8_GLORO
MKLEQDRNKKFSGGRAQKAAAAACGKSPLSSATPAAKSSPTETAAASVRRTTMMKSSAEQQQFDRPSLTISNLFDTKDVATSSSSTASNTTTQLIISSLNSARKTNESVGLCNVVKKSDYKEQSTDEDEQQNVASTSMSEDGDFAKSSRIRKRRYSQARIQPTRVKKVMQSDEDIGRMVASVPVAIGSAMEVFAEKLLLASAESVQQSSTKTLSPMHIKMAVSRIPHFAFLEPMLRDVQMHQKVAPSFGQQQSSSTANGD